MNDDVKLLSTRVLLLQLQNRYNHILVAQRRVNDLRDEQRRTIQELLRRGITEPERELKQIWAGK